MYCEKGIGSILELELMTFEPLKIETILYNHGVVQCFKNFPSLNALSLLKIGFSSLTVIKDWKEMH